MYADVADSNPKSRMRAQIDENLRLIYGETLSEPVPDRLTLLLEQLRSKAEGAQVDDEREAP